MANTYLSRTQSASPTSATKGTLSFWIKRSKLGVSQYFMSVFQDSNNRVQAEFQADDTLRIIQKNSSSTTINIITNRVFRDPSSWYHVVLAFDTTQGTSSNRVKLYINGVQETSFSTASYPSSSIDSFLTKGTSVSLGAYNGTGDFTNGIMSHINLCDGTQYDASAFGSTDSTTGEWKINTSPSVTYGTNGYFILKDGNSVTDQSGEGNNFTVGGGTLTKTEDSPSNVFATWNYVSTVGWYKQAGYVDFYNGSTRILEAGGNYKNTTSTVGAFTGKYYFETKMISPNNSLAESTYVGVITATDQAKIGDNYNHIGETANSVGYNSYAGQVFVSNSGSNYGSALANGDILCVALDVTNKKVYFRKNADAWFNSGNPESGATGTGAVSLPTTGDAWLFGGSPRNSSIESNFGNGYFGSTQISSAGTNASGIGIFEYDVPTGYTALSTKGLNL